MSLSERVAVNAPLLVISRMTSAAAGLAAVAVSTRYLGATVYGSLTIAMLYIALASVFTDAGLYLIAAREIAKHPEREQEIEANALTMGFALSLLIILLTLGSAQFVYAGANDRLVRLGIAILLAHLVTAAPIGVMGAHLIAHQRSWWTMAAAAVGSLVSIALVLIAATQNLGFAAIAGSYALVAIVNLVVLRAVTARTLRLRLGFDYELWRQLGRWALPQGGILILGVLYLRADGLLLSFLRPHRDVALYGVAFKVVEVLFILPQYLMLTLFPAIARLDRGSQRLAEIMQKTLDSMLVVVLPLVVAGVGFATDVVGVLGGKGFGPSVIVLQILMIGVAFWYFNAVFGNALVALNLQGRLFRNSAIVLIFNVGLNLALIPPFGPYGAAVALAVTEVTALTLTVRVYREVAAPPRPRGLLRLLGAAGGMVLVPLLLDGLLRSLAGPLVAALVGGALATLVYVALLYALRAVPEELLSAVRMLRQRAVRT